MAERTDPLDALRAPVTPVVPDPAFAAALRARLRAALAAAAAPPLTRDPPDPADPADLANPTPDPTPDSEEPPMRTDLTNRPRNGVRHGDVSYITLGLPDVARGRAFYGAVLGWRFSPGSSEHGARVDDVMPMIGLWDGEQPAGGRVHGAVLAFRVDAVAAAVAAVRAHGGTVSDPHPEPYAMVAEGRDDHGLPFYLHEMPSAVESRDVESGDAGSRPADHNGDVEGDVSYLTMVVPDLAAARAFYGGVFGWTFHGVSADGAQVGGVAPQAGMTTRPHDGAATPGVVLCYRVDDIAAAVGRVRDAGGRARDVAERPYGLEAFCADDQGTPFYLHQL